MRLTTIAVLLTFAFLVAGVTGASAIGNEDAKVMLHLGPVLAKGACATNLASCMSANVQGAVGSPYYAYVIVSRYDTEIGLAGVQFGLQYNGVSNQGVDHFGWTLCAALNFADDGWPNPGLGNAITWDSFSVDPVVGCQHDSVAVAGYVYVQAYSPDNMSTTPRPIDSSLKVADCNSTETELTSAPNALGFIRFSTSGTEQGGNPCVTTPVEPVTWGRVKAIYRP